MFRTLLGLVLALSLTAFAGTAAAQVTYNFQGGLYDPGLITNNTTCTVGECATYTGADRVTASITFAAALAPNLTNVDVSAQVTAFSFTDGVTPLTTGPGASGSIHTLLATTDGAGVLTNYTILLERTPGPPYVVNAPADPNSRFSYVVLGPTNSQGYANAICSGRSASSLGSSPGNCSFGNTDSNFSTAVSPVPTSFTTASPATVPTMSEWAMILFGLLLAGGAAVYVQRRRFA